MIHCLGLGVLLLQSGQTTTGGQRSDQALDGRVYELVCLHGVCVCDWDLLQLRIHPIRTCSKRNFKILLYLSQNYSVFTRHSHPFYKMFSPILQDVLTHFTTHSHLVTQSVPVRLGGVQPLQDASVFLGVFCRRRLTNYQFGQQLAW